MTGTPDGDAERIAAALDVLREDAAADPRPGARAEARRAMHRAVAAGVPRSGLLAALLPSHPRRLVVLTGALTTMAAVAVVAAGWDAPAGSAFHDVRLAREHVALTFSGDPNALRLSYAEDRLREAAAGTNRSASLAEAADLLGQVRAGLSSSSPLWTRFTDDERELADAEGAGEDGQSPRAGSTVTPAPSPEDGSPTNPGGEPREGSTAEPSSGSGEGSGETGQHSTSSTATRTPEPSDGAEGSASTPAPSSGTDPADH